MLDFRRKIVQPPEPTPDKSAPARHDSKNGSRLHYPAYINSIIIGGEEKVLDQELKVHFKLCKENKRKNSSLPSTLAKAEVVFSELVYLLLGKAMSAKPYLAMKEDDLEVIVGVASDELEDFVSVDMSKANIWSKMDKRLLGRILMALLITSEDDAHKNNMGSRKKSAPQIAKIPLKIDNDMNWYDPIFSRLGVGYRFLLHPLSEHRHDYNSEDIDNFPVTKKFRPHYWMTRPNFLFDKRGYKSSDISSVSAMKDNVEFKKGAYFQLLSFILLPEKLLRALLLQHLEETDLLFPLVLNTWIEQQANLKAAALGSENFRSLAFENKEDIEQNRQEFKELVEDYRNEINQYSPNCIESIDTDALFDSIIPLVNASSDYSDTELHASIRSKNFRFDESMRRYGKDLCCKNEEGDGDTPIELAVQLGMDAAEKNQWENVEYFKHIAQFLADQKHGPALPVNYFELLELKQPLPEADAPITHETLKIKLTHKISIKYDIAALNLDQYKSILQKSLLDRQHNKVALKLIKGFSDVTQSENDKKQSLEDCLLDSVKNMLNHLNNDTSMTLKMKKNAAILAFQTIIPHLRSGDDFTELREILDAPESNFIKQLTSRFEIVRAIRGLYGVTSTYKTIAHSINSRINECKEDEDDVESISVINGVQKKFSKELHSFFGRHTRCLEVETFEERVVREQPLVR